MSMLLADLNNARTTPFKDRAKILALAPDIVYDDGRTKQCHKDECDISKIMARFDKGGTISHVNQFQGVYADYSDYDFHEQTRQLTQGREIFDALPAEVRREFHQDPQAFFDFVNHPDNQDDLLEKLPALAAPGTQNPTGPSEPQEVVELPEAPVVDPSPDP